VTPEKLTTWDAAMLFAKSGRRGAQATADRASKQSSSVISHEKESQIELRVRVGEIVNE
jgi:hypothetical protein